MTDMAALDEHVSFGKLTVHIRKLKDDVAMNQYASDPVTVPGHSTSLINEVFSILTQILVQSLFKDGFAADLIVLPSRIHVSAPHYTFCILSLLDVATQNKLNATVCECW